MKEMIVAHGLNYEIGANNQLLWNYPEDLKYFKEKTLGKTIVMGRKTFDSIKKPLLYRTNVVITRSKGMFSRDVIVHSSIEAIKEYYSDYIILGGQEIYNQFINDVDILYVSLIPHSYSNADAFFCDNYINNFTLVHESVSSVTNIKYQTFKRN